MTTSNQPANLPLSLPPGTQTADGFIQRAAGYVTLTRLDGEPGYFGNWQPVRVSRSNQPRVNGSWIAAWAIDWSGRK